MKLNYKNSGVDYNLLDPIKKRAQKEGFKTAKNLLGTGFSEVSSSRGESAYLIESADCYYAFVEEGLGTKNLIADEMRKLTGKTYYEEIGYDTVISIVMDLTASGAKPLAVLSYWAIGDFNWLLDRKRLEDFITGWRKACDEVGVSWGGGETPILKDIIYPDTIDLAGAAWGIVKPKNKIILGDKLKDGDSLILFESSGIHVNGLTLARKIADALPAGYATQLGDGKLYGEVLLTPTRSYTRLVQEIQNAGVNIHYMVNITGHGWRKIMRANRDFTYILDTLPDVPEVFHFIQKKSNLSDKEMYATFNMGAGFVIFVDQKDVNIVLEISKKHKIRSWVGGFTEKGEKQVIIKPLNIIYKEEDLQIR